MGGGGRGWGRREGVGEGASWLGTNIIGLSLHQGERELGTEMIVPRTIRGIRNRNKNRDRNQAANRSGNRNKN